MTIAVCGLAAPGAVGFLKCGLRHAAKFEVLFVIYRFSRVNHWRHSLAPR